MNDNGLPPLPDLAIDPKGFHKAVEIIMRRAADSRREADESTAKLEATIVPFPRRGRWVPRIVAGLDHSDN